MGNEVLIDDEIMIVFGGIAIREVEVDGTSLFNNCTNNRMARATELDIPEYLIAN